MGVIDWITGRKRGVPRSEMEQALHEAQAAREAFQRALHNDDFLAAFLRPQSEESKRG